MIANEEPVIANSLWSATARPSEPCAELQADVSADVAIVGAGFTGLSAALHLAQMGRSVVVLEAQTPGVGRVRAQWRAGQSGIDRAAQ
jgi:monoamine oxidase